MKKMIGIFLVCFSTYLCANNFYIGVQTGYDDYSTKGNHLILLGSRASYSATTSVTSQGIQGGIFVGYHIIENYFNLGIELGASTTSASQSNQSRLVASEVGLPTFAKTAIESASARENYAISLLPGYQVSNNVLPFLRFALINTHFSFYDNNPSSIETIPPLGARVNDNLWGGRLGVGSQYQLTPHIAVRGEFDYSFYETSSQQQLTNNYRVDSQLNFIPRSSQLVFGLIYQFA